MIYFRKCILVLIFFFFASNAWANIVQKLIESNYIEIIRESSEQKWYVGTVIVSNNKLNIIYESGAGESPTIMAYKKSDNRLELILKCLPLLSVRRFSESEMYIPVFYLLSFYLDNNEIKYECNFIENPASFIIGFTFNRCVIHERSAIVRAEPTTESEMVSILPQDYIVTVTSIGNDFYEIFRIKDYWLEINFAREMYGDTRFWIYGFYVRFPKEIILE